jgi:autotransporter-associated beta strand protein
MKKITLFFALLILVGLGTAQAGVVTTDQYKFLFNGVLTSTIPSSPAITATTATTTTASVFGVGSGSATIGAASLAFGGSGAGNRGSALSNLNAATTLSTTKKEIVEFDWYVATTAVDAMAYNAICLSDNSKNGILVLAAEGWVSGSSGVHVMNLTPSATYLTATTYLLAAATYTSTGNYKQDCATFFAGSFIGADFPNSKTYHVRAKLDFATHVIDSLTITRSDDATKVYTTTNLAFLSASATNVDKISSVGTRGKNLTNSGNGGNSSVVMTIDNYQVYTWEVASTTTVDVKYYDADNTSTLIKSITRDNQAVGGTYTATGNDKTSFSQDGFYYAYSSMQLDNPVIAGDGTTYVEVLMKKFPVYSGLYSWTGAVDGTWNELNANFSYGLTALGYQPGNGVEFPESGAVKTVTVDNNYNLGSGDLTISGDAYTIQGGATLTGTGKLNINLSGAQTATLNVSNSMTGTTAIAGGNITLSKSGVLGSGVDVTGAATLNAGASAITVPALNLTASVTLNGGTNNSLLVNGLTIPAGVKASIISGYNHASTSAYAADFAASGTLSAGSELEINGTGADNRFGMTSASTSYLANTKLTLKGNPMLYIHANQGAATTINVGTLVGESGAKLGWGGSSALDRTITWSVGALNESSEYAGTITNTGYYNSGGSSYLGNNTNFAKVGTGTLTFSGAAKTHNGSVAVSGGGKLKVTGSLGKATSAFTVSGSSILAAADTGKIVTSTIVMGETDSLTIAPTAKTTISTGTGSTLSNVVIEVNADTAGILVIPADLAAGTKLLVKSLATPAVTWKTYKIVNAAGAFAFASVTLPSDFYSYNQSTGVLYYRDYTTGTNATKGFSVYPTVVRNEVNVDGNNIAAISIIGMTGQTMKVVTNINESNNINISNLSNGVYFVKVRFADGTQKVQNILLQK